MEVLSVAALLLSSLMTTSGGLFGEACDNGEVVCDSDRSLTCDKGTCGCVKPSEMIYDAFQKSCVGRPGERCVSNAIVHYSFRGSDKERLTSNDCVENGYCNKQGYCECESSYFGTSERCAPQKLDGETCTKDGECSGANHFYCVRGTCSCNEKESVFDSRYQQCVAKVGVEHSKYGGDYCECTDGYTRSKGGLCLGHLNSNCVAQLSPCIQTLECVNSTCTCPFPQFQKSSRGTCVSRVHGPCTHVSSSTGDLTTYNCEDPNAECVKNHHHNIEGCQCKPGWIESRHGPYSGAGRQCRTDYGSPCAISEECEDVADLVCMNGKCACKLLHAYDSTAIKCRGLVGAMCDPKAEGFCIDGASCVAFRNPVWGTCQCVPPATANSFTRTCS